MAKTTVKDLAADLNLPVETLLSQKLIRIVS